MNKVSAFRWIQPFARGLARDLRVRWAPEEAGLSYRLRCEARPAFQKALADQMAVFSANAPPQG